MNQLAYNSEFKSSLWGIHYDSSYKEAHLFTFGENSIIYRSFRTGVWLIQESGKIESVHIDDKTNNTFVVYSNQKYSFGSGHKKIINAVVLNNSMRVRGKVLIQVSGNTYDNHLIELS